MKMMSGDPYKLEHTGMTKALGCIKRSSPATITESWNTLLENLFDNNIVVGNFCYVCVSTLPLFTFFTCMLDSHNLYFLRLS